MQVNLGSSTILAFGLIDDLRKIKLVGEEENKEGDKEKQKTHLILKA